MTSKVETIVERVAGIAQRAASRENLTVWDVEVLGGGKARTVRIYIDKPEGVTHGDCEKISEQVGTVMDVENVLPESSYHLEVSSPGVERRLRTADHFRFCSGKKAKLAFREPLEGQRRWEGVLGLEEGAITLAIESGQTLRFRPEQVEKANLKFDW
jgi:ribosome maturation factor RimP